MPVVQVQDGSTGETTISAAALRRAVDARLSPLGVRLIGVRVVGNEVKIKVEASGNPVLARAAVEDRLGYGFWIDLGLVDLAPQVLVQAPKRRRG